MVLLKNFTLYLACLLCTGIHAQVTIGSAASPNSGALLDLKENNTTTKGLGLPRVALTDLKPDTPTDLATSIGGTGSWILAEHTALAVYNVLENQCAADPIYKGMYVFDGNQWEFLGNNTSPNVHYYTDTRPQQLGNQTYPYSSFGAAGSWMLENIRYLPPVGDPFEIIADADVTGTAGPDDRYYTYPNVNPATPAVAPPTWSKEQGLLYMYAAATLDAQNGLDVDQGQGEQDEGPTPPIQGICPPNWHIPSDRDWNELEKEIYNHADKYSSYTLADLPFTATYDAPLGVLSGWQTAWESGFTPNDPPISIAGGDNRGSTTANGHGMAMLSPCELSGITTGATGGKSLSTRQGGFSALPVTQPDLAAFFWTASSYASPLAWGRIIEQQSPTVKRVVFIRYAMISVRCKKN